jgi:UDP-glucose 4-epimerase
MDEGSGVSMREKEVKVRALFAKMLEDAKKYAVREKYYAEDMKGFHEVVQWKFGPIRGYQVFDETEYSFEIDVEAEDPSLVLGCTDLDLALQFLNDEIRHWPAFGKTDFLIATKGADGSLVQTTVGEVTGFAPGNAPTARSAEENAPTRQRSLTARLLRIPAFRPIMERTADPENSNDVRIPINESLGTYENQPIPLAVLEHFINKASHVYLFPVCPCRAIAGCKDHDPDQFGCMALGKGVLRMRTSGRIATKEEAMERSRRAVAAGLLPSLGRVKSDTIIYRALPEQGDLMHLCFCCPCCCVEGSTKDSPRYLRQWHQKMEGVSVTVDEDLCDGCELCLEVCIYGGMEVVDHIAVIDREGEDRCRGCGRCERACPTGAIAITIEDDGVERMIARIESHVDVT